MIGYLKGKIIYRANSYVVVEAGEGIGYRVNAPKNILEDSKEGEIAEFYIFNNIKEGVDDLYGLSSPEELGIFELLLNVSGVGPKVALSISGGLGRQKIISAIENSDTNVFRSISGVGAKVAAKIIVELKTKISGSSIGLLPQEDETVDALISLGYLKQEILPILGSIPSECKTVQQKVKFILSNVGKSK
jgi:Holliday junction DNA helicase RuvA